MSIEEVGQLISQRLLQGSMYHEQFANYYLFLGLEGYKSYHEHQFLEETLNYRKFITFFMQYYNKLIPNLSFEKINTPHIIPENWHNSDRQDVDSTTCRNAVTKGCEKYVNWQIQTKRVLEDMSVQLESEGEITFALEVYKYIKNVKKELIRAQKEYLEIKATDYDLPTIVARQKQLDKKYSKKIKGMA